jgi:hypothetical protein
MFLFCTLPYTLSGDFVQEGFAFFTTTIQMLLVDVQAYLLMQHCESFWVPSCTDVTKPKSVVAEFTGKTMTDLLATPSVVSHLTEQCHMHSQYCPHTWLWKGIWFLPHQ